MAGASLRELSLPRFALRRDEAAASLSISPSLFDIWISEGKMPQGKKIGGVVLWDTERLRQAWQRLIEIGGNEESAENPFDGIVA